MRILLVDDEPLARNELAYLVSQNKEVTSVEEAESIEEAMEKMLQAPVDLIFLDVHLINESGLSLAEKLQRFSHPPQVIFATAYDEYAVKAFEYNATDYVLKPFENKRIQQAIVKAAERNREVSESLFSVSASEETESVPVHTGERIYLLKPAEIIVASVENNETTLYTKTNEYVTHDSLQLWEKRLPAGTFMRIHRSYLLNLQEIKEIQPWFNNTYQVTTTNGMKVPVSRSYLKAFRERVGI